MSGKRARRQARRHRERMRTLPLDAAPVVVDDVVDDDERAVQRAGETA